MINFNNFNDEIGKIIVIFIISPILIYKSFILQDLLLGVIALLLFIYDFYWYNQYFKKNKEEENTKDKVSDKYTLVKNDNDKNIEVKSNNQDNLKTEILPEVKKEILSKDTFNLNSIEKEKAEIKKLIKEQ